MRSKYYNAARSASTFEKFQNQLKVLPDKQKGSDAVKWMKRMRVPERLRKLARENGELYFRAINEIKTKYSLNSSHLKQLFSSLESNEV